MLSKDDSVKIEIFSVTGMKVEELFNGLMKAGDHTIKWNADNVPSGVYFYTITTSDSKSTRKLILLK